ncbi:MAG: T9SS type A sorting domain-containing protein [Candidatus Eisenbacteria bacterium]|uniref:T9SS type A sorting domain-containing protein n=1 Tax=Eiseniibacteriota bacterium TaxID=2212470 RepID=A0A538TH79_UNCEI|nr:MAG: T9SS type A sorting domain-containing protein [Candidatus Eisenbacteria bacterium]
MRLTAGLVFARFCRHRSGVACLVAAALGLAFSSAPAIAGPGSGTATIAGSSAVVAGASGTWAITYVAAENFGALLGGQITIEIPSGWTAPQSSDSSSAGYVRPEPPDHVTLLSTSGQTITVQLGALPATPFLAGDSVTVVYGWGGGAAAAVADSVAPATATFTVTSDPLQSGSPAPIASSPTLAVAPDSVTHVRVVDPAMTPVGVFTRSADEDTTRLLLLGYDRFDNPARLVTGVWTVTGGIGTASPATGTGTVLTLTGAATGYAVGDSGVWADSTGLITVTHGAYAGLLMNADVIATAGAPLGGNVTAVDADGNGITTGPGSSASILFAAYADSLGGAAADPNFVSSAATLSGGTWNSTLTARRAGTFWLAARDTTAGFETSPRRRIDVAPAAADHITARPDTLHLVAGVMDTVTVLVFDLYGNRAPVPANETLTLWTDRIVGRFYDSFGSIVYEGILAAGADSVDFRYRDTQAGAGVGRLRAIDANGSGPSLGAAAASVVTSPNVPLGFFTVQAAPDTLVADGVDSSLVTSEAVRDGYGNVVAAGERFTAFGTLVAPITDVDPGTPGAQWVAAADGTVSGWVGAGLVKGAGLDSIASERGGANGKVAIRLIAGAPAGAIALVASPDSLAADSVATRALGAAGLHDANGSAVENGEPFTVSTTLGSIASPDQDGATPGIQVRASGGAISFTLFGGDSIGTATVSAASARGTAAGSVNVRLVPGATSAAKSSVAATTPAPVGGVGSTVAVTLHDSQGHPIAGVPSDSISVGVSGVSATVTPQGASTDGAGLIELRATATVAAPGTVSVTVRGVTLADSPTIVFQPGPLDHYALAGPAGPLTAGTADALQVGARDSFNNSIPGLSGVVLRPTVLGGGATVPDSATIAGGLAAVPFTPTAAAPLTIQVRDDASRTVTYGPVPVTPGPSFRVIAVAPSADTLAAGDSVAVRARLFDAWGNTVAGGQVVASVVAGGGTVAPAADAADASGFADFMLHAGSTLGTLGLRFLAAGSAAEDSVRADTLQVTVIPAGAVSLRVLPDSLGWIAGAPVRVRVEPLDAFGNVVLADTATIVMRPSGALRWAPAFGALSGGAFVTFASDTIAESVSLAADRVGGGTGSAGPAVVAPAAAASVAIASGDGQTAIVAREVASPLRVRVRDAYGNLTPGASIVFGVAAGNGSVDAIRGGAADSVGVSDGSAVAACEVARLGTVAGVGSDAFRARLLIAPAAQVLFTASASPDTAASLSLSPPSLSLAAGGVANVTATARDLFGNLAPGAAVTFYVGAPSAGTLESLGSTSGGSGSQSGTTGGAGALAVRYRAPATTPAADSIFARGASIAPVGIRATVGAATTASLQVLPDSLGWIAGDPVRVRVRAIDAFGNPVPADTATVGLSSGGSATFTPAFGAMTAGEFVTFARDTLAESVPSLDASRVGGGTGSAGPVTVRPASPAGAIAIAAPRDTLTADGRSSVTVALGPVRDAFGNLVTTGSLVLVSATAASLLAPDASPLPGLDLATASDGRASLVLTAPASAGADTLRAWTRVGAAAGQHAFVYEPPPSLAYTPGTIAPQVVVPGSTYSFRVRVTNTGTGTIQIGTGTTISFGAGAMAYTAALAAPVPLVAGQSDTLRFAAGGVSSMLTPGTYAPALRAVGTDGTGDAFDFYLSLAGGQVHAAGVSAAGVSASPSPVPLGYGALALVFDVTNPTTLAATIDAASLGYTIGAFTTVGVAPSLPAALPAGGTTRLTVTVSVPPSGIPDGTVVGATLTATAGFGGSSVVGSNLTRLSFQVQSAARIVATTGVALPSRYLRARTFGPTVRVSNTGTSTVTLARGTTRLVLEHPGGDLLSTGLNAATAVLGSDSASLVFDSLAVPASVARGRYAARLYLNGTESGQAFADTIPLDPDSVSVLEPPLLSVVGPLSPDSVSAGQTRPLRLRLANGGDVAFDLDPGTMLRLGSPLFTDLSLGVAAALGPGAAIDLDFAGAPLGSPLSPGSAAATLEARGTEDGRFREEAIAAGLLEARPPAAIAFVAGSTVPDTVRAGQSYDLSVAVRNSGGSPITLDPASSRILLTDGVEQVVALGSGAPVALGPGGQATLSFPSAAFPAALASQPYPVTLFLYGSEWGQAESTQVASPQSEILVIEPAAAVQIRPVAAAAPIQAAAGMASVRTWGLELMALVPPGGVTAVHLTTLRLTVLTDGSAAGAPSAALGTIAVRSTTGALLAQSAVGGANPVTLTLSTPLAITAGAESLYVEVGIAGSGAARAVALRVAADTDVLVLEDLTATPVPVRGGGGVAFSPLTSPTLTLFDRAHGYPNPFRAGREDVRLSYLLTQDGAVRVKIYTLLGDLVREIALAAGATGGTRGLNEVPWDGRNGKGELVRPGLYVARIEGSGASEQIKVGVLR